MMGTVAGAIAALLVTVVSAKTPMPDIVLVHLPQASTSHLPPSLVTKRFAIPIEVEIALLDDAASPELAGVLDAVRVVRPDDTLRALATQHPRSVWLFDAVPNLLLYALECRRRNDAVARNVLAAATIRCQKMFRMRVNNATIGQ